MVKDGVVIIDVGITRVPDDSNPKGMWLLEMLILKMSVKILFYNSVPGGLDQWLLRS
jgi:methylenetetrahydrofolate dehydrogenase (NADP+)/methenyltetrahydrofolate cyclohydrolase